MGQPIELQIARVRACILRPYYSSIIWAMRPVEAPGIGTMATDKHMRLYYDPEFIKSRPVDVVVTAIYHEIGHSIYNHHERLKHFAQENPVMSNVAGDLAINCGLEAEEHEEKRTKGKAQIRTEPTWQYPKQYQFAEFLSAEEYWDLLKKKFPPTGKQGYAEGAGDGSIPQIGKGACGSAANGQPGPWEQPGPGDPGHDPNTHESGVSQVEGDLIRDEVARQTVDFASKNQGKVPAGMLRWASERLKSPVNYAQLINFAVRAGIADAAGFTHAKFGRLHRRQQSYGDILLPTRYRKIPRIAVGIDTSGSMSDLMLSQALAEVEAAIRSVKAPVQVLTGDYGVASSKKVFRASQVELRGGGGTDVGLTIAAVAELRPKIDLGIYVTDCYTPWPADPPAHRVVIISTADGAPPPWHCRVIKIDVNEFAEQIAKKQKAGR
jgi:predicted metal-dependent peptidase